MDRTPRDPSHFRALPRIIFKLSSIAVYIDVSQKKHVLNFSSEKFFGLVDAKLVLPSCLSGASSSADTCAHLYTLLLSRRHSQTSA